MTFQEFVQSFGPVLLQTTVVLAVASLLAMPLLRSCRRPWVHQFVWGGVLLLGLAGMRIPVALTVTLPVIVTVAEPIAGPMVEPVALSVTELMENVTEPEKTVPEVFVAREDADYVVSAEPFAFGPPPIVESTVIEPETSKDPETSVSGLPREQRLLATHPEADVTASLAALLFVLWGAGVFVQLLRHFVRYFLLLQMLRHSEPGDEPTLVLWMEILDRAGAGKRRPKLAMLPEIGPAMIRTPLGYTLLLSKSHWTELDTELQRGVMRHELAHFLNGDLWKTLFVRLVVLLHWFNPLAHLAARRFEEAIEWSADSFSYGSEKNGLEQFAAAMLSLHETTPQNYRYRVAFGTKDILRRLEFLKRLKTGTKESPWKTGLVLGFSLILFVLGTVNIRIVAQEKKAEAVASGVVVAEIMVEKKTVELPFSKPRVDERLELVCIVARLAGFQEFRCKDFTKYNDAIEKHFADFKDHEVIRYAKFLRDPVWGIRLGQDRVVVFGTICSIENGHVVCGDEAIDRMIDYYRKRKYLPWTKQTAKKFARLLDDFYVQSRFHEFFQSQRPLYEKAELRFAELLGNSSVLREGGKWDISLDFEWFDRFFGKKFTDGFRIIPLMASEDGGFEISTEFLPPGDPKVPFSLISVGGVDKEGNADFLTTLEISVLQYVSQPFAQPLVEKHYDALKPAAERLLPLVLDRIIPEINKYPGMPTDKAARYMLSRYLVYAALIKWNRDHGQDDNANDIFRYTQNAGFLWMDKLLGLLDRYDKNRDKYPTMDDFMPEIVKLQDSIVTEDFVRELKKNIDELKREKRKIAEADRPRIVSTHPANGAKDVDPDTKEISVTFDRPMAEGMAWYTRDGNKTYPERTSKELPVWSDDKRTCTMRDVVLKPGKTYNIWFNTEEELDSDLPGDGFRSAEDMPLRPVHYMFSTRAVPGEKAGTLPMRLTVLDTDGKPIVGATGHASRVDKDNKRPGANFTADESGVAQIERTTPENASWACFNIKTAGYTPYFAVWQRNREPKYPPVEFTVTLDKAKTIGGTVLDPDGKPVEGVKVEFSFPYGTHTFNDESTHCAASGRTDAEGRWICGYVPMDVLGNMRFYLHHPDFQSTQIDADLNDLKTAGDGKYSHVFTIQRGNEINGTVKDESGKPIANVRVEIQFFGVNGSEKDMYRRTTTDAEGRYRFATCPLTDSAAAVAQAPGFAGRYVETPIGSEPKTVDFVLGPSKPLKLRFTDEKGKPIENPWVSVSRWGPLDGTSIAPPIQKMLKAENYEPLKLDDGNGNWVWNDALAGPFQVAVGAEGFMTRQYVDVEAKDEVQTIVLKPWLEVAGTVVDDETGKPIPMFRIAEGYGNVAEGHVSWQRHGKREGKDGSFRYVDNQPQRFGRRLRIEAEGYENCDSRLIENDEGSIELAFRLKRAEVKTSGKETFTPPLSGLVLMPDGKPAVDARVLVSTQPNGIYVSLNSLDHHLQAKTARDGRFTLPAIKFENDGARETGNRFALVLIHEDGCRYLLGNDFDKNHNTGADNNAGAITLEPWGELEGTLMIGNRPCEGSQIGISRRERDLDSLRFDFHAEATTGKDGKFSIRKLFPGEYSVSRNVVTNRIGGSIRSVGAISKWVTVESGKKTRITLGGTGRPVVGRVVGTPEAEKLLKESGRGVRIRAPYPPYPEALETPIEIGKIRLATQNDSEKGKELFAAWQQTEAGKKYLADAEAVQREWNAVHKKILEDRSAVFGGKINDDGSFRVEDVESGDWVLEIDGSCRTIPLF